MKISEMSVELIDYMGSDLSVVNAARVSFAKESDWEDGKIGNTSSKDQKLLHYLATNNHWTPFAHAFLSFRIRAPIFVARQLVKHQVGLAWNEVSRRYVDDEPEFWVPPKGGWRGKPVNAKQGSTGLLGPDEQEFYLDEIKTHCENSLFYYNEAIKEGMAPEQARMFLPLNTHTEWIWSGSLAAFARVCKLRLDPHAQAETREVAEIINKLIPVEFEHSWSALLENYAGKEV